IWSVPRRRRLASQPEMMWWRDSPESFGPRPIPIRTLVATSTRSRRPRSTWPRISSASPAEYTSAVSIRLTPASRHMSTWRSASSTSVEPTSANPPAPPNVIVPMVRTDMRRPDRPSARYSMGRPYRRSARGGSGGGYHGPFGTNKRIRTSAGGAGPGRSGVGRVPGHGGGRHRGQAGGEHGGAVAGHADRAVRTTGADRFGHGGQQGGAHRGADLAAGVDHAAYQALVGVGHAAAGQHHRPERGACGAEADQHDDQQDRAVAVGGQPGQDREAGRGRGAGQDQEPADADLARQPGPEHARGEADHALRGDGQAGEQGRFVQDLLQVQRHDEHLAAVPQAQQERQGAAVAQAGAAEQRSEE